MAQHTLWRAADVSGYSGQWSCWAEARAHAKAYTDNPGFGGAHLYQALVDLQGAALLDLTCESDPFSALYEALYPDADMDERVETLDEWRSGCAYVWEVWGNRRTVREHMTAAFLWVIYEDNYPAGCITWAYLGTEAIAATRITKKRRSPS